ncbi:hypothetical protein FPRO03_14223 [Fusarium proliferatum]|nr:hypothetical protein FPRO03_14223 [Fusarium proliferatum]
MNASAAQPATPLSEGASTVTRREQPPSHLAPSPLNHELDSIAIDPSVQESQAESCHATVGPAEPTPSLTPADHPVIMANEEDVCSSSLAYFSNSKLAALSRTLGHTRVAELIRTIESAVRSRIRHSVKAFPSPDHYAKEARSIALHKEAVTVMAIFGLTYMNRGQAGEIDPDFQRTFWVIYSLESEFCFNTGRASAIPYHDISCPIPHTSVSLNSNFNWLQVLSSYALMISRIYERLFSVKAKSLSKDVRRTEALRAFEELENWKDSIPESFCPGMPIRSHRLGKSQAVALAVQICFCYHNVRIALSRVSISASTGDFENQMRYKLSLTDSARAIIEVVHLIHLEPFVLPWIQYHMPQSALFLLFDFIIENPYHEETQKDLSYMQMVASYFMRFQYATKDNADSTLSTELYQIASKFLEDVASSQNSEPQTGDDPDSLEQWLSYNNDLNTNLLNELLGSQGFPFLMPNCFTLEETDFSMSF